MRMGRVSKPLPSRAAGCRPALFIFLNSSSVEIFINNFYLKSSHRLKSISGTIMIIVNNSILILWSFYCSQGVLKPQPSKSRFQLILIENLRGLQARWANILKIKDN